MFIYGILLFKSGIGYIKAVTIEREIGASFSVVYGFTRRYTRVVLHIMYCLIFFYMWIAFLSYTSYKLVKMVRFFVVYPLQTAYYFVYENSMTHDTFWGPLCFMRIFIHQANRVWQPLWIMKRVLGLHIAESNDHFMNRKFHARIDQVWYNANRSKFAVY